MHCDGGWAEGKGSDELPAFSLEESPKAKTKHQVDFSVGHHNPEIINISSSSICSESHNPTPKALELSK